MKLLSSDRETVFAMASPTDAKELIRRLMAITADLRHDMPISDLGTRNETGRVRLRDGDVIITHVEVNDKHGVGALTKRLFQDEPNIVSIRSCDLYEGQHELGELALKISHHGGSRDAVFARTLDALGRTTVRRILCVPYFPDDVRTAIAVKEIFGVPMCTYLMDDQNVCADGIPDRLMGELLAKSSLRLAISPELCSVYRHKYGHKIWYLPPVAPSHLIPSRLIVPRTPPTEKQGVIIGNIWGQRWVDLLRGTVRDSGVTLTWYCSGEFRWLPCGKDSLAADGIVPHDPLREEELNRALRDAWFAVVPSGMLDEEDDHRFIAQLSLPSRIPYMMATSHVPILVLGHCKTAAARFVEQFGIGTVAGYERQSFIAAIDYLTKPEVNLAMRRRALAVAGRFSDAGASEWIWRSLAARQPVDDRYQDLMPAEEPDVAHLLPESSMIHGTARLSP